MKLFMLSTVFSLAASAPTEKQLDLTNLGENTLYPVNEVQKLDIPDKCKLSQVQLITRHGTRFPQLVTKDPINSLIDYLVENASDYQRKDDLKTLKISSEQQGMLLPQGHKDLEGLATRMRQRYEPTGLYDDMSKVFTQSTDRMRVVDSAHAYLNKAFDGKLNQTLWILDRSIDADLTSRSSCAKYDMNVKSKDAEMIKTQRYPDISERVSKVLGLKENLNVDQVQSLFDLCAYTQTVDKTDLGICQVFDQDDFPVYSIVQDFEDDASFGYSYPFSGEMMCSLLTSIYKEAKKIDSDNYHPLVLRFAHSETIMPLAHSLNLFKDDPAISASMPDDKLFNHNWNITRLSPFAGNFIFEIFTCDDEKQIRVLVNEQVVELPGCNDGSKENGLSKDFCALSKFEELYPSIQNCNYDELCGNTNSTKGGWNDYFDNPNVDDRVTQYKQ